MVRVRSTSLSAASVTSAYSLSLSFISSMALAEFFCCTKRVSRNDRTDHSISGLVFGTQGSDARRGCLVVVPHQLFPSL